MIPDLSPYFDVIKLVAGALAIAWGWFMVQTKNNEKRRRVNAEQETQDAQKKIEDMEHSKKYQATEIARIQASKRLADKRSDKLLEKLKDIDPSHLNDIELNELYADPLGFTDISTNPNGVDETTPTRIRKR